MAKNKSKKEEKITLKKYLHNLGLSAKDVIDRFLRDDNAAGFLKERYEELKDDPNIKKPWKWHVDNMSDAAKKNFFKWLNEDNIEDETIQDQLKRSWDEFVTGIKTGRWQSSKRDEFDDLLMENPDFLFEDDVYGVEESYYNKGGKMSLQELKESYIKNLRIVASKEALDVLSPIEPLNDRVLGHKESVIKFDSDNVNTPNDDLNNISFDDKADEIKDDILSTISTVVQNEKIESEYKEPLANALALLFATKCQHKLKDNLSPSKDIQKLDTEMNNTLDSIDKVGGTNIGALLNDKLKDIKIIAGEEAQANASSSANDMQDIEKGMNETAKDPQVSKQMDDAAQIVKEGKTSPDSQNNNIELKLDVEPDASSDSNSLKQASESFNGFGESTFGFDKLIVALFAIPINLGTEAMVNSVQDKYGPSFTFKQPMIVSDTISNDVASKFAKAIEIKSLIEMKGLLESTVSALDGGLVVSRAAKASKILSPVSIQLKKAASIFAKNNLSYDDIISAFSESFRPLFPRPNKDEIKAITAATYIASKNPVKFNTILSIESLVGAGEAGEFIDHRRNALPSYMDVQIEYKTYSDLTTFKVDNRARNTSIGMQVLPRKVSGADISRAIVELDKKVFENTKVTKDEKDMVKKAKNLFNFWEKKGSKEEVKALHSNEFKNIMDKIKNVKSPLFHLCISYTEYMQMKEMGTDLMMDSFYNKVMEALPIISIAIIDEDSDILHYSEGSKKGFTKYAINDFVDSIGQYEKELKTILKYNQI